MGQHYFSFVLCNCVAQKKNLWSRKENKENKSIEQESEEEN